MGIYLEICPTLEERLQTIREYSCVDLSEQISRLSLHDQLPLSYLSTLNDEDRAACFRATLLCYCITGGSQALREMQLKAIPADQHENDSLTAAGTGSGKTPNGSEHPTRWSEETDDNHIINEDTPQDDKWWAVRHVFPLTVTAYSVSLIEKCLWFKETNNRRG